MELHSLSALNDFMFNGDLAHTATYVSFGHMGKHDAINFYA
jgi:hypothetical protein